MKTLIALIFIAGIVTSCHRVTREEQCAEMIKHEKRRLPRNVVQGVTLDSMKYVRQKQTIEYYHTMSDSIFTDEMIEYGKKDLQAELQQEIINSVSLKRLKDEGVSFKYVYLGSDTRKVRLEMMFKNSSL